MAIFRELVARIETYFKKLEDRIGKQICHEDQENWHRLYPFPSLYDHLKKISSSIIFPDTDDEEPGLTCVSDDLILDEYIERFAIKMGKITGAMETAKDRCQLRKIFPMELGETIVDSHLSKLENLLYDNEPMLVDVIEKYLNKTGLPDLVLKDSKISELNELLLDDNFPHGNKLNIKYGLFFSNNILLERNMKMTEMIVDTLNGSGKSNFFFAGVAHFFGHRSINKMLEEKGFKVEKV